VEDEMTRTLTIKDNLPPAALDDPFGPPPDNIRVRCLHCDLEFDSDQMVWDGVLWCCPALICGGAGYGFDIFPVTSRLWGHGGPEMEVFEFEDSR
jgi:hypothetical protein